MSRARRVGLVLPSVWAGGNALLAAGILVHMLALGGHAPALAILFERDELAAVDPRAVATVDALAILFNACALGLCSLALVASWTPALRAHPRGLCAVVACLVLLQAAGSASHARLGHANLALNVGSAVLSGAGGALAWRGGGRAG